MLPPDRTLPLRDGRTCLLRLARPSDAAGLLALERALARERHGMVKLEDELPADAEAFAAQAGPSLAAPDHRGFRLVAEMEGRGVVAEISFIRFGLRMLRHGGTLGIGVHPEAQGVGLGRALMSAVIDWAREHRDPDGERVRRIELYVRADNARAVALYDSCGFVREGVRRAFVRGPDGALIDDYVMARLL